VGVRAVRRAPVVLVLLALLIAGVLTSGDRERPAPGPAGTRIAEATTVVPLRIMPLGASSTEGIGSPATAGYRGPLYSMLQRDAVAVDYVGSLSSGPPSLPDRDNEGHSGATLATLAPHVTAWVAAAHPDVVLLHAGTNDLGNGTPANVVAARLDAVIGRIFAAAPQAHLVVAGVWAPLRHVRAAR
jgi:acyl-CoA thioesterase-1